MAAQGREEFSVVLQLTKDLFVQFGLFEPYLSNDSTNWEKTLGFQLSLIVMSTEC